MTQLSQLENIDVSTQRLLTSVIDLRKNRWGRSTETNGTRKNKSILFFF